MVGNPSIPQREQERAHLLQAAKLRPGAAVLSPPASTGRRVMAGVLGLAIVTLMFYYVSRVFHRMRTETEVEVVDPADGQGLQSEVQFSDLAMSQAIANEPLELHGRVLNAGNHRIIGVIVQLTFKDSAGRKLSTLQKPILSTTEEPDPGVSDDFSGDPIEPDESRIFRVLVRNTPPRWDHNLPEVKVITVSTNLD
jgi:hypothetical protein